MTTASTVSVPFTLDDVVSKVREVAAERPDFVYSSPNPDNCLYRHGENREEPGCIIGQALDRLGYVVPQAWEGSNAEALMDHIYDLSQHDDVRASWLRYVQGEQDRAKPWGEAVSEADRYYPEVAK